MTQCLQCRKNLVKAEAHYGLHPACFSDWFDVDQTAEFSDVARLPSDDSAGEETGLAREAWNSSFFQGQFQKYAARLNKHEYIIKVQQEIAPELPDVEMVCNQIAMLLDIVVPPFCLIEFYNKRAFVSENFITSMSQVVALNHIYHYIKDGADYTCENLLRVVEQQTNSYGDAEQFVRLCLYDALIGNHDRHGRNLGFIVTAKQTLLAPAYDNTSALGLEKGNFLKAQFSPRGKIITKASLEPTVKEYVKEFIRLGYPSVVEEFYQKINLERISQIIEASFCSALMKSALQRLITARIQEYQDAL